MSVVSISVSLLLEKSFSEEEEEEGGVTYLYKLLRAKYLFVYLASHGY